MAMRLEPIGRVQSKFEEPQDPDEMRREESVLVIDPDYAPGLEGIEESDFLQVVFYFHRSEDYELVAPRRHGSSRGVFASRSPHRPVPIGVTTVKVLACEDNQLRVKGLDALNETPVLDLKPYAATMDALKLVDKNNRLNDPRIELGQLLATGQLSTLLIKAAELHGAYCPFLGVGVKLAAHGLQELGLELLGDSNLCLMVGERGCYADSLQYVTGCSWGNGRFLYRELNEPRITLWQRSGSGLQYVLRDVSDLLADIHPDRDPEFYAAAGGHSPDHQDSSEFREPLREASFELLKLPASDLASISSLQEVPPPPTGGLR